MQKVEIPVRESCVWRMEVWRWIIFLKFVTTKSERQPRKKEVK
jgi:hypothetical protein